MNAVAPAAIAARTVRLADGSPVVVRPLHAGDRAAYAAAVSGSSAETRYWRFATPKPRLTGRELTFLTDVDHRAHEALTAFDLTTGQLLAVVRYVQVPGHPGVAELAAGVTDTWQGRGLATLLTRLILHRADTEGFTRLRAQVLAGNSRTLRGARRLGFRRVGAEGGFIVLDLPLPSAHALDASGIARRPGGTPVGEGSGYGGGMAGDLADAPSPSPFLASGA